MMLLAKHDEWGDNDYPCDSCPIKHELDEREAGNGMVLAVVAISLCIGLAAGVLIGAAL